VHEWVSNYKPLPLAQTPKYSPDLCTVYIHSRSLEDTRNEESMWFVDFRGSNLEGGRAHGA
jgi:hypothetical protein